MDITDQVLKLYETGATPEVIAKGMEITVDEVNAMLFAKSGKYRMAQRAEARDPSQPRQERMLDIICDLAENSDNQFIKLSAAKYARDDLKGRRDVAHDIGINLDALKMLAGRFDAAMQARRRFLGEQPVTIDVSANG